MAAQAADLAVRETGCCSFFTFSLITTGGSLWLETSVPDSQDARAVLRRPVGEWIEFLADCGRSDAEIDKELRNQRLTLAELDE